MQTTRSTPLRSRHALVAVLSVVTSAAVLLGVAPQPAHADEALVPWVKLDQLARDVAYDPASGTILVTTRDDSPEQPGKLVVLDAASGDLVRTVDVGPQPGRLQLGADGAALFVGVDGTRSVTKLSLPALTPQWTHALPSRLGYPNVAGDIAVTPADPDLVLVALSTPELSPSHGGVVAVDAAGVRASATPDHTGPESLVFTGRADVAYGIGSDNEFYTLAVGAGGVSISGGPADLGAIGAFAATDGTLVYTSRRAIVDPTVPAVIGRFGTQRSTLQSFALDTAAGAAYYLERDDTGAAILLVFDLATRDLRAQWAVPADIDVLFGRLRPLGDGMAAFVDGFGNTHVLFVDEFDGAFGEYTPVSPVRILDTRNGLGRGGVRPLGPGETFELQVAGIGGVPVTGASAVVLNVTAVRPTAIGYLTVFPSGIRLPDISNLNFRPGDRVPNLVTTRLGTGGRVSIHNPFGNTDVLVDVAGFYATTTGPSGGRFTALTPTRIADTRLASGVGRRLGPADSFGFDATGIGDVPAGAVAVAFNVTAARATQVGFVTVHPGDVGRPVASNLNVAPGPAVANQVIVRLPPDGVVRFYNDVGAVDLIIDVVGYYAPASGPSQVGRYVPFNPFRIINTRQSSPFPPPGRLWAGDVVYIGSEDEPMSAYVLNVTVTSTIGVGFVTAFPFPGTPPRASTVNYGEADTVANHAMLRTGPYLGFANGDGRTHLVVDMFGGFT